MDEVDKYRYRSLLTWWLALHENIYYQHRKKPLDNDVYEAWARDLEQLISEQNVWQHKDELKQNF